MMLSMVMIVQEKECGSRERRFVPNVARSGVNDDDDDDDLFAKQSLPVLLMNLERGSFAEAEAELDRMVSAAVTVVADMLMLVVRPSSVL